MRAKRRIVSAVYSALLGVSGFDAGASEGRPPAGDSDRYDFTLHSTTHAELFRRALLPGPKGAVVETDSVVPVHQFLSVRVRDVDSSFGRDSIDVELAAWGRGWFGERQTEELFDGDVQIANVRYHQGPLSLRLGRQHAVGGAARFVRFDGLALAALLGEGFDAEAYAGLTALPRWNARPGYHTLGSAADSLLRDPDALPDPERSGYWLGGGRLGFASERVNAGVSFHEQHEPAGLARRSLGLDARVLSLPYQATLGGGGILELDARRIQDARLYLDAVPVDFMDVSLEYLHTEPALFLSRQSVLSVFSTDAYEDLTASGTLHAAERFALEGAGSVEFYDDGRRGARSEVAARVVPGPGKRTLVRIAYARVVALDNGYHSLRASLSRRLLAALSGTLEAYFYLYDEAIRDRTTSEVYAGTLSYQATRRLELLWGASLAQSPYARADAQTLVRASYAFDFSRGMGP